MKNRIKMDDLVCFPIVLETPIISWEFALPEAN